jgi:cytochrome c-type biogenesis protein CcmE
MTPRHKRMAAVVTVLAGVSVAALLALRSFRDNLLYYYTPTQLAVGEGARNRAVRLGGMVTHGSIVRQPGSLEVRFVVTDYTRSVGVRYSGVLPDLFRDGQGVVVHGHLANGEFLADEVLAKHDEKYMPPNMAGKVPPPAGLTQ